MFAPSSLDAIEPTKNGTKHNFIALPLQIHGHSVWSFVTEASCDELARDSPVLNRDEMKSKLRLRGHQHVLHHAFAGRRDLVKFRHYHSGLKCPGWAPSFRDGQVLNSWAASSKDFAPLSSIEALISLQSSRLLTRVCLAFAATPSGCAAYSVLANACLSQSKMPWHVAGHSSLEVGCRLRSIANSASLTCLFLPPTTHGQMT